MAINAFPYGYVPFHELADWVRDHPMGKNQMPITVCLWGEAGTAKTESVKAYTKSRNIGYKRVLLSLFKDARSLIGMPRINPDTGELEYIMPDWLPMPNSPEVLAHPKGGVLFLDEVNRADPEVIQGLFELLDDGKISLIGYELPPGWSIVCAANPPEKGYNVHKLDTAFMNRMINYAPGWSETEWINWAIREGKLPKKSIDFVLQAPHRVAKGEARLPAEVNPIPSPRAITYLATLYEPDMPLRMLHTLGMGLIGEEAIDEKIRIHLEGAEIQPLTGREVLSGKTGSDEDVIEIMKDWWSRRRKDLIRASTLYAIADLYSMKDKSPQNKSTPANRGFYKWFMALDNYLIGETIAYLQENLPDLLDYYMKDVKFRQRVPNSTQIVKPDKVQMEREERDQKKATEFENWNDETKSLQDDDDDDPFNDDDILKGLGL